jgi:hypothetical protein
MGTPVFVYDRVAVDESQVANAPLSPPEFIANWRRARSVEQEGVCNACSQAVDIYIHNSTRVTGRDRYSKELS